MRSLVAGPSWSSFRCAGTILPELVLSATLLLSAAHPLRAQAPDPLVAVREAISAADADLREGRRELAEDRYRAALEAGSQLQAPLDAQTRAALARVSYNLGVIEAQRRRFLQAAEYFERAEAFDPSLPNLQYSRGVAYFNAQAYDRARDALTQAIAAGPGDVEAKRMLALTAFKLDDYARAAALLGGDPQRDRDASLQYVYGVALVRSGRAGEAERVFSQLLTAHGESAQISVVLGLAQAEQGDFTAAVPLLERARRLDPAVPEAATALGVIHLRQGRLDESERAFRDAIAADPADAKAHQMLATVLELTNRPQEAIVALQRALRERPDFTDAKYLLGKVLLTQGAVSDAIVQLDAAARLAPEDAKIHYQLAQAYQRNGQAPLAEQQFELFRQLKEKQRRAVR